MSFPAPMNIESHSEADSLIASEADAESLIAELEATMDGLIAAIEDETRLVRQGQLEQAAELTGEKASLAAVYVKLRDRVSKNRIGIATFAPSAVERVRSRHEEFTHLLKINLAVLATAREVAEDIIRNVSASLGKFSGPDIYGHTAQTRAIGVSAAKGIAIDRNL